MCSEVFERTVEENRPRLIRKYRKLLSQESTRSEEGIRSETFHDRQRVNNLSCLELPAEGLDLLSKGPNYAITQEVSDDIILEAKKGVERLAYAKRWQGCMRRKKESTRNTTDAITNDSTTTDNLQLPNHTVLRQRSKGRPRLQSARLVRQQRRFRRNGVHQTV